MPQTCSHNSCHASIHPRYRYAPGVDNEGVLLTPDAGLDLVEQADVQQHARSYAYMGHLLTRYTDYTGFGQNLEWYYDPAWAPFPVRCIRTVADDGSEDTRLSYDAWFNETTLTEASGRKTIFTYNSNNLVTGIETGIETVIPGESHPFLQRVWDQHGNLLREIDPQARTTRYTYDDANNLLSVTAPDGAVTTYEYDGDNNPVSIIDPARQSWQRAFDKNGNLTGQTNPAGHATAYSYNEQGQLIGVKDAKGGKYPHRCCVVDVQ